MRNAVSYRQILFQKNVLDLIRREVKKSPNTETGGALIGYLAQDNCVIVTDACGPGPRAELKRYSVLIDGKYTSAFCDRIFEQSRGKLDYIGDWHRHPGWSLRSSSQDLTAMHTIRDSGCCSIPYPITAIYRRRPEKIIAYVFSADRLKRVKMTWID
jgi:integrative and conjugative element protein (TIGR02256 family)